MDGTLIDTSSSIVTAVNRTRDFLNLPSRAEIETFQRIGLPARSLFDDIDDQDERIEDFIKVFRRFLMQIDLSEADVYLGVKPFLEKLYLQDVRLAVATSKPTDLAIRTLSSCGIADYFEFIQGSDDGRYKPDPWVLHQVEHAASEPINFYFGDRLEDAQAAEEAGIKFMAICQTSHSRQEFAGFPFYAIFDSFQELNANFDYSLS